MNEGLVPEDCHTWTSKGDSVNHFDERAGDEDAQECSITNTEGKEFSLLCDGSGYKVKAFGTITVELEYVHVKKNELKESKVERKEHTSTAR